MKGITAEPTGPEPKPNSVDIDDIAGLFRDTGLDDPLTEVHTHFIPVGKPRDFFRVHPDLAYRRRAEIYVHKSENEVGEQFFLLGSKMQGRIEEARPCVIVTTIDRIGAPRLWPIMAPRDGEKDNAAWISARAIAKEAINRARSNETLRFDT